MIIKWLAVVTLIIGVSFIGCVHDASTINDRLKVQELSTKVEALEKQLRSLEASVALAETLTEVRRIAYLTPGQSGYSNVQLDIGALAVSMEDVKPYANGSKVTLEFGNPLAATINGLKAKIEWGSTGTNGHADNDTVKFRHVTFNETLRPGSWTRTDVVLEGVPPSALGFVRVRDLGNSGIRLGR